MIWLNNLLINKVRRPSMANSLLLNLINSTPRHSKLLSDEMN